MKSLLAFLCLVGVAVALTNGPSKDGRLVGGEIISNVNARYAVSLQNVNNAMHLCGGVALKNSRFVLTSAWCAQKLRPGFQQVRYGTDEYNYRGTTVPIVRVIVHPHYDVNNLDGNIALVETSQNFTSTYSLNYPCTSSYLDEGELLTVAGWGQVSESGQGVMSVQLRQVKLPYAAYGCFRYYADIGIDLYSTNGFCAGNLQTGGAGLCHGDEGTGAVRARWATVHGIGSIAQFCGQPRFGSVFTSVDAYSTFIKEHTGLACIWDF